MSLQLSPRFGIQGVIMGTASYCRVSTEDQEREGSSLGSQLEACLKLADERGWTVPEENRFSEVYSGSTMDRPQLDNLRELARNRQIDSLVIYSTDRLSRDPVHLLLLIEEFDKAGVELVLVTEPLDNSLEGQLLNFVRGWASKVESEKIKERTVRGRKSRARNGRIPSGSGAHLFGYTYMPGKGVGEDIRYIKEEEAKVVQDIFRWLVEERLSLDGITYRLRDMGISSPSGKGIWQRQTVYKMLKNPAYCGKTYAFTQTRQKLEKGPKSADKSPKTRTITKPREEWIEIPGATPAIISEDIFEVAQEQLRLNKQLSNGNTAVTEYLLKGHLFCAKCGRPFWGSPGNKVYKGKQYRYPYYQCSGKLKRVTHHDRCGNRRHAARRLEELVIAEVEKVLTNPEIVLSQMEQMGIEDLIACIQRDMDRVTIQIDHYQKQKERAWSAFLYSGDEDTFKRMIADVEAKLQAFELEKADIESRMQSYNEFEARAEDLKEACKRVSANLGKLTTGEKQLALDALGIKVLVDGDDIRIQGTLPLDLVPPMSTLSEWRCQGRDQLPSSSA